MNSVSWFIYLAHVSGSIGALLVFLGVLIITGVFIAFATPRMHYSVETHNIDDYKEAIKDLKPLRKGWLTLAVMLMLLGNLLPGKETIYAVAASQVGEQIIKSGTTQELANDATKALQQWIKKQIEPDKK